MTEFIPFALPDIGDDEIAAVTEVLRSGWLTTGPRSKQLEQEFAATVGGRFGIALNSGTAALHLALEAIGVQPGDEVIVPTFTFAATAEVVRYMNATPVMVDVCGEDHEIDAECCQRAVTSKTKAIIPVHYAGQPGDLAALLELARTNGFRIVEDAAHSFPCQYRGRPIGSWGDVTCFSFYVTKTITTGEGGMAVTQDEALAERMRVMGLHGISKDAWKRYSAEGTWYYEIIAPGYKYNLTDIAAALGLAQLHRADQMLERRRAIAGAYARAFGGTDAVEVLRVNPDATHAWQLYVIKLREQALTIDRNRFIEELRGLGIGTSVHFIPLHMHPYYREKYGYRPEDFPVALDCYRRSISLPIYSRMTDEQVGRVVEAVTQLAGRHRR
jgi:dTDP-4-amino-4,6-dideoxygalactose transaminase